MKKKIILIFSFIIIFSLLINIIIPHYKTKDGLCVLGYHGVVSDEDKKNDYKNDRYTISLSQFERQMKYLYDHGYKTYTMYDVYCYKQGTLDVEDKAVVLTFDDGYKNFNDIVKPVLEKYQFYGTCFVIGKHLEDERMQFLKIGDIIDDEYVSYFSHSYNLHRKANGFDKKIIEELSLDEIDNDFKQNKVNNSYFAFPYGRSRNGIETVLKMNQVKLAFSYNQMRHVVRNDDNYYLPRYMIIDLTLDFYFHWIVQ